MQLPSFFFVTNSSNSRNKQSGGSRRAIFFSKFRTGHQLLRGRMATRATKFFEKKIVVESETTVVDTSKRPRRRPTTVCRLARSLLTSTTLSWRLSNTFSIVFPFQSSVRGCFGCLAESWSAPVPTRGLLCRKAYRVEMKVLSSTFRNYQNMSTHARGVLVCVHYCLLM